MRIFLGLIAMVPLLATGAECSVRSGPNTAALVELYTSEGCSSCPPADRWMSEFTRAAANGDVVPLAFHVHYWDYIGWRDAYADARYTERQRDIAAAAGASSVYTPQVVVGGRDFPQWRSARSASSAFDAIRRKPAPVTLDLTLRVGADRSLIAEVNATAAASLAQSNLVLVTAVSQNGLGSKVTAGENRGETLKHDFVVRDFAVHRGLGKSAATFKPRPDWNPERMSVAVFAQNMKTGEVLQAVSLPVCR
jgi:hypothetical protein